MDLCAAIAVLIPAQNEAELLPPCLRSVLAARACLRGAVRCEVVLVADRCLDRTAEIAEEMLQGVGAVLRINDGNVGAARALAARQAMENFAELPISRCWLANTDADCVVPETWLLDQVAAAQRGVAALAGIVDVEDFSEHLPHVASRFREMYLIHRDGTHPHVHGANLGVRADAYLRAGGWQAQPTAEDHDLWRRLGETGALRLADARLRVVTSGRRQGRAPGGFAGALAARNGMPAVCGG